MTGERSRTPDKAWEQFSEQYPDLAEIIDNAVRYDNIHPEDVMLMMKRGYVLAEVLALLRDGNLGSGRIPPDVPDSPHVAGGFDEPDNVAQAGDC